MKKIVDNPLTPNKNKAIKSAFFRIELSKFLGIRELCYLPEFWDTIKHNEDLKHKRQLNFNVRLINLDQLYGNIDFCLQFARFDKYVFDIDTETTR